MEATHFRESDSPPPARPKRSQRPHESDIALLPKEITALGVVASSENEIFISAKSVNVKRPKPDEESETKMVGQLVHGVVDGVFDAGYLLSARIGNSDAIFRGVVFRPGMIIPPSRMRNVAANGERVPKAWNLAGENHSVNVVPSPE